MGTQEYLLDKAERKGIQKGKIEGKIEICQKLGLAKPEVEKYFKEA